MNKTGFRIRAKLSLRRTANQVVLGFLFFMVLAPTAIFIRVSGKRLLAQSFEKKATSYWLERKPRGLYSDSMKHLF